MAWVSPSETGRDVTIKKVAGTYRDYLTRLGRSAIAAACRIYEQFIIPAPAV